MGYAKLSRGTWGRMRTACRDPARLLPDYSHTEVPGAPSSKPHAAAKAASPMRRGAQNITLASESTAQVLHGHSFGNSGNKRADQPIVKELGTTNNHLLHLRADVCNPVPQHGRSHNSS
ncbi:unnamed protein product [Polarella glacialis]|uniref:Uncharacterized protein n=1 Tax=Polarella glacialis TaxID=89957 RepID=A0A813FCP0_POLGL|nr:unnamed protein product [Polarella glacialis]